MGAISDFLDGAAPKDIEIPKRGTISAFLDGAGPSDKFAKDYAGVAPTEDEMNRDFKAGVGRGAKETLYALGQMVNRFAGTPQSQAAFDARMREALPPINDESGSSQAGRVIGSMFATAPATAIPGLGAAGLLPRLAAGAVGGAATATLSPEADTTSPEFINSKIRKAEFGAALGAGAQGIAAAAGRLVSPIRNTLNPEQQRLANVFEGQIAPLTAGQATGSRPLQVTESVLENLPGSSARQTAIRAAQHEGFTQAVLDKAGINASAATPQVMRAARDAFGAEYNNLARQSTTILDQQFQNDLQNVAQKYQQQLKADQLPIFNAKIKELEILSQPTAGMRTALNGDEFQLIRTPITEAMKDAKTTDPALARALKGVKDSLDQAEIRSMPPQFAGVRADLDKRYAIFKIIEDAVDKQTNGQITPVALFNAAAKRGKGGAWAEGKGELNDLARAGKEFLKPLPDSFTSQRALISNLITGSSAGGIMGGLASGGDLKTTGAGAAGGMALGLLGPAAVQRGMGNPVAQAWLRNQGGSAIPGILGPYSPYAGLLAQ